MLKEQIKVLDEDIWYDFEESREKAADRVGCSIIYPHDNQLQVDIDSESDYARYVSAVKNLPEIILGTIGRHSLGIMIARGDLAVELGSARLAEIQEELLWLCEAAHVPVIWAKQVLESIAKKGTKSRAEFTDAAMAVRAECVMLNKGPYILDALEALLNVMTRMEEHQHKKFPRLLLVIIS